MSTNNSNLNSRTVSIDYDPRNSPQPQPVRQTGEPQCLENLITPDLPYDSDMSKFLARSQLNFHFREAVVVILLHY